MSEILEDLTEDRLRGSFLERLLRYQVFARLERLERGRLTIIDGGIRRTFGRLRPGFEVSVTVRVLDARFYLVVALEGTVGAGGAYADGYWSCDDLAGLARVFSANRDALDGMERGLARLSLPLLRLAHFRRKNNRRGSKRNIREHYDLGNDFFQTFLDPTWMYSAAIYDREDATLEEAQIAKLDRICRKLGLVEGQHVLEIGTGWGGFALHAATRYGCKVTTTTVSPAQYEFARERIARAGLTREITLLLEDYRELGGRFDRLVSIEMLEAVGHEYHDAYFGTCSRLLAPDGAMLLQSITIQDQHYQRALKTVDFIQRYVFPGCCIPSLEAIATSVRKATDLRFYHLEDIGPHYAKTLRQWREALLGSRSRLESLGYDERFVRLFEFYFAYCEGGFEERVLGDVQLLLVKPQCRLEPILPRIDSRATSRPWAGS
jgi:cyclopropane-fatty-acyl-phospholipid synthase